jgi:hypothetical protein
MILGMCFIGYKNLGTMLPMLFVPDEWWDLTNMALASDYNYKYICY